MRSDKHPEPSREPRERRRAETGDGFRITPQVVFGVLIIGFGLVLMADNLNIADADRILRFWPLVLVVVGALRLIYPHGGSSRVFGGFLLLAGLGLTAQLVLGMPIDINDWWPVVLIGFGIVLLSRARSASRVGSDVPLSEGQSASEFAVWSGKQRRVASPSFRRADLTAIMGGVELDLRAAGTASGQAVVDVFVMWGGIEIWVPPDWAVNNEVTTLMGGAEDASTGTQDAKHTLTIRGFVVMGGLEIKT